MRVFLETPRLVLRRFTPADVDNLVSLNADPDVMRFLTGGMPAGRDEIENELLPAFAGYYERSDRYGFWAAIEKRTGEFLGWFYLAPHEGGAPDEVEPGFRLRKSAWGKGYATEGARADPQGLHRVRGALRRRGHHGSEQSLPACAGQGGPDAGPDLSSARPGPDRGRGIRGRRVRAAQSRLGAAGPGRPGRLPAGPETAAARQAARKVRSGPRRRTGSCPRPSTCCRQPAETCRETSATRGNSAAE